MQSHVMPSQWWIQLVESSPLENHDQLRESFRGWIGATLAEDDCFRFDWSESSSIPTAFSAQGNGAPPNIYNFLGSIQQLISRNEYIIFVVMVEAATLNKGALSHVIVTKNALARVDTGEELIAKAKSIVLDADEELAARS